MQKRFLFLLSTLCLGGCSIGYNVTYDSYPQSAELICADGVHGLTPYTITYQASAQDKAKGEIVTTPCYAQWVSGAKTAYPSSLPIPRNGIGSVVLKAARPKHDNLDADIAFDSNTKAEIALQEALMLERMQLDQMRRLERQRIHMNMLRQPPKPAPHFVPPKKPIKKVARKPAPRKVAKAAPQAEPMPQKAPVPPQRKPQNNLPPPKH